MPHFAFSYSLYVDGKPLQKFTEKQSQIMRTWALIAEGIRYRVVFDKQTLNIYVNGQINDAESVFVSNGTEMRFTLGTSSAMIKATSTDKKEGVVHQLFVGGSLVEEDLF
ncbi:unnamed protein product [Phaedon cochleariae]|uniref:Uncharacterized protein n=1 Tax=Phaedon cochleariae TaxID=80249 RepID=A0A9P0GVP8_PHACE|nr:unnamed protein product [Phaedon cochleariae]